MTFQHWQDQHRRLSDIAYRIDASRYARANQLFIKARVGLARNVAHNALLARKAGRPWAEVDYRALREARRIDDSRMAGYRIVEQWAARTWPMVQH